MSTSRGSQVVLAVVSSLSEMVVDTIPGLPPRAAKRNAIALVWYLFALTLAAGCIRSLVLP